MVVFTCGHCGESVQKPKVEKHYLTKCRNRNPNLSCMDCFKDFIGKEYEAHTKCITEEERYSGKGFTAKEKKGEKKQNAWVEMLQSVLDEQKSAPSNVLRIIETISKHNNTPRKKPKFINFVKNVCGHKTHHKDIDQAWDMISVKLAALSVVNNQNNTANSTANGSDNGSKDETDEQETENANKSIENGTNSENVDEETKTNGHSVEQNGDVPDKKLTKKQRKEEKKRRKYEAELQSAVAPVEEVEEETETKKGKKKKNKSISESADGDAEENGVDSKGKNKKRKRQDTVCSVNGNTEVAPEVETEVAPVVTVAKEKTQKKKLKMEDELDQDSDNLHNQNVAKIEELSMKSDKFDWHAVIMSVLQKKDNEMPFKRLQKKVLSEYMETTGRDIDDRIADKFIKKLRSAPKVRVDKNRVYIEV